MKVSPYQYLHVPCVTKSCGSCGLLKLETPLRYENTGKVRLSSGSHGICGDKIYTLGKFEKNCLNCHKVSWQLWHAELETPLRYAITGKVRLSSGSRGICDGKICTLGKSEKTCCGIHVNSGSFGSLKSRYP